MTDYQYFKWVPPSSDQIFGLFNVIDNHFWCLVDTREIAKNLQMLFSDKNHFEVIDLTPYKDLNLDNTVINNWGIQDSHKIFRYHEFYFDLLESRFNNQDIKNFYDNDVAQLVLIENNNANLDEYKIDFIKQLFYTQYLLEKTNETQSNDLIPMLKSAIDMSISVDDIQENLCNITQYFPNNLKYYVLLNHLDLLYE